MKESKLGTQFIPHEIENVVVYSLIKKSWKTLENLTAWHRGRGGGGTVLHTARTIYKQLHPWHFLSPGLHLCCVLCLGPPWSALSMPGSPCLYLCHWNDLEECLWQVHHRCCPFVAELRPFASTSQRRPHSVAANTGFLLELQPRALKTWFMWHVGFFRARVGGFCFCFFYCKRTIVNV